MPKVTHHAGSHAGESVIPDIIFEKAEETGAETYMAIVRAWKKKYFQQWQKLSPLGRRLFLAGSHVKLEPDEIDRIREHIDRKEPDDDLYPADRRLSRIFWERILADSHGLLKNPEMNRDEVVARHLPREKCGDLLTLIGERHQWQNPGWRERLEIVWQEKERDMTGDNCNVPDLARQVLVRLAPDAETQRKRLVAGLVAHYEDCNLEKVMERYASPESRPWQQIRVAHLQKHPAHEEYLRQLWLKKLAGNTAERMMGWIGLTAVGGGKHEKTMLNIAVKRFMEEGERTGKKELYLLAGWHPKNTEVRREMAALWKNTRDHDGWGWRICAWRGWLALEENETEVLTEILNMFETGRATRDWLPVLKTWTPRDKSVRESICQKLREQLKCLVPPGKYRLERRCLWTCLLRWMPDPDLLGALFREDLLEGESPEVFAAIVQEIGQMPEITHGADGKWFHAVAEIVPKMTVDVMRWVGRLLVLLFPQQPAPEDREVFQERMNQVLSVPINGWQGMEELCEWSLYGPAGNHPDIKQFWQDFWMARMTDARSDVRGRAIWHLCRMVFQSEHLVWNEKLWETIRDRFEKETSPEVLGGMALMGLNLARVAPNSERMGTQMDIWKALVRKKDELHRRRGAREITSIMRMVQMELMLYYLNWHEAWEEGRTVDVATIIRCLRKVIHLFPESISDFQAIPLSTGTKGRTAESLWQELWDELEEVAKIKSWGNVEAAFAGPKFTEPQFAELQFAELQFAELQFAELKSIRLESASQDESLHHREQEVSPDRLRKIIVGMKCSKPMLTGE